METSLLSVTVFLLIGILIIVLLTTRYKVHAFFALVIAAATVGLGVGIPVLQTLTIMKEGFGHIMQSLGFIIVLGTTLGVLLEKKGCTSVLADFILKKVGKNRAPLAMNITGYVVGLPVFCDSGYIVLSSLNNNLARITGKSIAVMSTSLAAGLYSVHCLIPPHPGAAAAGELIKVDFARFILAGIAVAIPACIVGYIWALYAGRKITIQQTHVEQERIDEAIRPSVLRSILPIAVPIVLIALSAFGTDSTQPIWKMLVVLGNPVIALAIGILLAATAPGSKGQMAHLLQESAEKAGGILVIIGAGGAFGAILAATRIGDHLAGALPLDVMGLFFPFIITAILKTAQGSSTVAIITAASIVLPLLPELGLQDDNGRLLCVLAMGGGSMMVSHANDAYFWVISKFSGIDMKTMMRVYTPATVLMGLTVLLTVYIMSLFLL